ncbi:hypothetical protein LV457_13805 [Mycobacterium sp. MYCO198283]|uniref:hypothetical protein n=1 Tax=Mycobacterium sp. MYCO198283 TaxID=2883505 RepID=UPI001E637B57|nr:hypothetical protein [Mycobacterium sp. MYCO198283]MCG5433352.1 hypothetical protein [Mycobacterium sp. MYCO198283]
MKVSFTERMAGYYTVGSPAYDTGDVTGRRDGQRLSFRVIISTDDVRRVRDDPRHRMAVRGDVWCKQFAAGAMPVVGGAFDLFTPTDGMRYEMRYRLPFRTRDGSVMTLLGHKNVGNDWGWDAWRDTTTLFTRLVDGAVAEYPEGPDGGDFARGILRLDAGMFARQLTTFRGSPAGVVGFNAFFLDRFRRVYQFPPKRRPR